MTEITYHTESFVDEWGKMLCCPECQDFYVHFEDPKYKNGNDNHEAWAGRGDAVEIPLYCEQGHYWTVRFGFHKGQTYLKVEDIRKGIIK